MTLAAAALVLALVVSGTGASGAGGAGAGADPDPDSPLGGDEGVSLTVRNWGDDVSLLDAAKPGWAHLAAQAGPTMVTVRIATTEATPLFRGYVLKLTAPDSFGGRQELYCSDQYHVIESSVECTFGVEVTRGVNDLHVVFQAGNMREGVEAHGQLRGAELEVVRGLEVRIADDGWMPVGARGVDVAPGAQTSALRFRLLNTGDIPFRVVDGCQPGTVWPDQQIVCPVRAPRPAFALAGDYEIPVKIEDPAGGIAALTVTGTIRVPGVPFGERAFRGRALA